MPWGARQPAVLPLHRLAGFESANLEDAGAHAFFQPPPRDRAVLARDDDVEDDGAAEKMRFDRPFGGVAEPERHGRASVGARPWCYGETQLERVQKNVVSGPSSCSTFAIGLYTNCVPAPFPPHNKPSSRTPVPISRNTSEPESPAPTPALTKFWHSCTMFVPDTPVLTQVLVMTPWVQPVVRPTLLATSPTISPPSATIENVPIISSEPLFGPLV